MSQDDLQRRGDSQSRAPALGTESSDGSVPATPLLPEAAPEFDERVVATLSHLLAVAHLAVLPTFILLIIFLVYRDRSEYARLQAAQALVFSVVAFVLTVVGLGLIGFTLPTVCATPFILAFLALLFVYPLWAALHTMNGRPFEYLGIQPLVDGLLGFSIGRG